MGNASSMDNYESAEDTVLINNNLTTIDCSSNIIKTDDEIQQELNDTPNVIDTEDDTVIVNNNITNITIAIAIIYDRIRPIVLLPPAPSVPRFIGVL